MIEVPCEPHDLLIWEKEKIAAENQNSFYWKLKLGFEIAHFPIRDELVFGALKLALEKFSNELLPLGGNGVILYQGTLDFSDKLKWDHLLEEEYQEWLFSTEKESEFSRQKFALDCYGNYFQMLSHLLPDETPIFLLFEPLFSASHTLSLLSRASMEHFQIALKSPKFHRKGWRWDEDKIFQQVDGPKKGLVVPVAFENFELMDQFSESHEFILESRLNEEWDGLEEINLPVEKLSERGERMLLGFVAAGGKINRDRGI